MITPLNHEDCDVRPLRMGLLIDVVGYGARSVCDKEWAQLRVDSLIRVTLGDIGVKAADTDRQGTGDGMMLYFPANLDLRRALPQLLRSTATHLSADNKVFVDQLQLRIAVDVGPVSLAHLGFNGAVATNLGRLVDSKPPRQWLVDHPRRHTAVIISDRLHSFVVAENVPALPPTHFRRVPVQVKEATTTAWLWTGHDSTQ